MGGELRVQLAEDGADVERLDDLTGFLREELLQLQVEDVTALRAGAPPPGRQSDRRSGDWWTAGEPWSLHRSAAGGRVCDRNWLARGDGTRRTIRLEIGDDALELSEATAADQDRLITLFISWHDSREG